MKNPILKLVKKAVIIIVVIIIIILMLVAIIKAYHELKSIADEKAYKNAYGTTVVLKDGRRMNMCVYDGGDETMVILPGLGSIAPGYEYKGLANKLRDKYTVVVVEPFGYGLSDITSVERSSDNICKEIHEAINELGLGKYNLMAHSIAGEYAINYIKKYPDEVTSFTGIDISVPEQALENDNTAGLYKVNSILTKLGITRILCNLSKDEDVILPGILSELNPDEIKVYRMLACSKTSNRDIVNEAENIKENFSENMDYVFPEDLKVLLLVSTKSCDESADWKANHEKMLRDCDRHKMLILNGGHYLHLDCVKDVADIVKD